MVKNLESAIISKDLDKAKAIIDSNDTSIDAFLDDIREQGTLRCSKYDYILY